jgi:hypothetical protein
MNKGAGPKTRKSRAELELDRYCPHLAGWSGTPFAKASAVEKRKRSASGLASAARVMCQPPCGETVCFSPKTR